MSNTHHIRYRNRVISPLFLPQNRNLPPNRPLPNGTFDTRWPGTSFQVEAAPLGRGVACDAAGRAGSLRGPRRVFLCAESDLAAHRIGCPTGISVLIANNLTVICGGIIKRIRPKCQISGSGLQSQVLLSNRRLIFGVRPHECQIGSGEEYRPAVRIKTFKSCSDFW